MLACTRAPRVPPRARRPPPAYDINFMVLVSIKRSDYFNFLVIK